MKKLISTICLVVLVLLPFNALAWGPATHTYLAHELGSKHRNINIQEMYGSVVPDMFNLMYDYPAWLLYLYGQTHAEFMKVVDVARPGIKEAFGYGFASHNELWGADYTAHIDDLTCPVPGGYVVKKAGVLAPTIASIIPIYVPSIPPPLVPELSYALADSCVESAVDLLVSQNQDPQVGMQLRLSTKHRSPFIPALLCGAYAVDFASYAGITPWQACAVIYQAEKQFNEYMELYGGILSQDLIFRLDAMAEMGAQLAEERLLKGYGLTVDVPAILMNQCLVGATAVVSPDYSAELSATLTFVDSGLEANDIKPFPH